MRIAEAISRRDCLLLGGGIAASCALSPAAAGGRVETVVELFSSQGFKEGETLVVKPRRIEVFVDAGEGI